MKKTKLVTILLLVAMIVVSFASIVNAADAPKTTMSVKANGTTGTVVVEKGDTVSFEIDFSDKVAGANFLVEWNHDFLEVVDTSALAANLEEGRFEFSNGLGLKKCTIEFEVKETATGSDTIKVTPVKVTDGDTYEVIQESNSVKVELKKEETNTTPEQNTTEPENTVKEPENTVTEPENTVKEPTNTTKEPDKMPQTGFNVAPVIGVAALVIVATVAIRRRK